MIGAVVAIALIWLALVFIQGRTRDPEISNAAELADAAVVEEPPAFYVSDPSLLRESAFKIQELLVDQSTREPLENAPYFIHLSDGRYAFGYTDQTGRTRPVFSAVQIKHSVYWYDDAWDRWGRTATSRQGAAQQGVAADGASRRR